MDDLEALLAFVLSNKISSTKAHKLIAGCGGSCRKAYEQISSSLFSNSQQLTALIEKEFIAAQEMKVRLIPYTSSEFPQQLHSLSDCPLILYVKGELPQASEPRVAIIGTRYATEWGKESARQFARILASRGCWIISGLARGIDTAAHYGSLETGSTVAVIGSGLAHIYPKENLGLAEKIALHGALISEYPLFSPPAKFTFPKRNRLICSLSEAIIVAEAPLKSGSLITMEIGYKQKKPLFALPGRALCETSKGNHYLIKSGKARLIDDPEDVIRFLGLESRLPEEKKSTHTALQATYTASEQKILDILSQSEVCIEGLSRATSLPAPHLQATLIQLLLKNLVVELPGKRYRLI